jgi:glutaredoxin-related protein
LLSLLQAIGFPAQATCGFRAQAVAFREDFSDDRILKLTENRSEVAGWPYCGSRGRDHPWLGPWDLVGRSLALTQVDTGQELLYAHHDWPTVPSHIQISEALQGARVAFTPTLGKLRGFGA